MDTDITLNDLFSISSGKNEDGNANAASSLLVFQQKNEKEEPLLLHNVLLTPGVEVYASGGGTVCVFEFPATEYREFMGIATECLKWLNAGDDTNESLFLQVIPMLLEGQVILLFSGLIYCDYYKQKDGSQKLILVFDNESTRVVMPDDEIDFESLRAEVDNELKKQEQEMDDEIYELEKELKELNEQISGFHYEFDVDDVMKNEKKEEASESERKGYRFAEEEEE